MLKKSLLCLFLLLSTDITLQSTARPKPHQTKATIKGKAAKHPQARQQILNRGLTLASCIGGFTALVLAIINVKKSSAIQVAAASASALPLSADTFVTATLDGIHDSTVPAHRDAAVSRVTGRIVRSHPAPAAAAQATADADGHEPLIIPGPVGSALPVAAADAATLHRAATPAELHFPVVLPNASAVVEGLFQESSSCEVAMQTAAINLVTAFQTKDPAYAAHHATVASLVYAMHADESASTPTTPLGDAIHGFMTELITNPAALPAHQEVVRLATNEARQATADANAYLALLEMTTPQLAAAQQLDASLKQIVTAPIPDKAIIDAAVTQINACFESANRLFTSCVNQYIAESSQETITHYIAMLDTTSKNTSLTDIMRQEARGLKALIEEKMAMVKTTRSLPTLQIPSVGLILEDTYRQSLRAIDIQAILTVVAEKLQRSKAIAAADIKALAVASSKATILADRLRAYRQTWQADARSWALAAHKAARALTPFSTNAGVQAVREAALQVASATPSVVPPPVVVASRPQPPLPRGVVNARQRAETNIAEAQQNFERASSAFSRIPEDSPAKPQARAAVARAELAIRRARITQMAMQFINTFPETQAPAAFIAAQLKITEATFKEVFDVTTR